MTMKNNAGAYFSLPQIKLNKIRSIDIHLNLKRGYHTACFRFRWFPVRLSQDSDIRPSTFLVHLFSRFQILAPVPKEKVKLLVFHVNFDMNQGKESSLPLLQMYFSGLTVGTKN